jgi:iron-sulfur cluster repair protein YtfE (RIC family)
MHQLGEMLDDHIRKEERVIFPMIEDALPEDVLMELGPYFHGDE